MNSEIKIYSYRITLNLFYVHNDTSFDSNDSLNNEEPALTLKEINLFMNDLMDNCEEPRYFHYARSVSYTLTCGNDTDIAETDPFDVEYEDDGILKFSIDLTYEESIDNIKKKILMDSFEDSMMEGKLGNQCLVPSRNKYPIKIDFGVNNSPIYCLDYYELGYIDCRANYAIHVEKI